MSALRRAVPLLCAGLLACPAVGRAKTQSDPSSLLLGDILAEKPAAPKEGRAKPKRALKTAQIPAMPWEQLDAIAAEFAGRRKEAEARLKRLLDMQPEYAKPNDLAEMTARRKELVSELRRDYDGVNELDDRYSTTQKSIELQLAAVGFKLALSGGSMEEAAPKEVGKALQYRNMRDDFVHFIRMLRESLESDQRAFDSAETARAEARRMRAIVGAGTGAALVIVTLFVWGLRRRAGPDTVYPSVQDPAAAPGGATGAVPPQARLSGPAQAALSGPATPSRVSGPVGSSLSGPVQGALPALPGGPYAPGTAGSGTVPAASESPMPEVLNQNFRVEREIGRGGMGLVYEATDLTLQRKVAIKRMRQELVESKKELDMFLGEARLVASLKHPNLVEILSIFRESGQLYLVFEYVSGKALSHYLEDGRRLPHRQVLEVLRPVSGALDYAHSRKVIHRDLKPSNIMITDEKAVKVMDFGIAHQAKKTVAKLTRADAWGTPPYMAPEQELGTVSKESDLYSLGVCYYEMLTGELPFQGPNFLAQKREMVYAPPTKAVAGLPAQADAVVLKALQADPRNRFHSGAEFIAALESVEKRPA